MVDEIDTDNVNESEPLEPDLAPAYREALASLSRMLALAADEAMRLKVFENAVDEVFKTWRGIERSDALDALQDIAESRGFDPDWVQSVFARAAEAEPEQPKVNGKGHDDAQHAKDQQSEPKPPEPFPFIRASSFDGQKAPARRWLVNNRIPMRNVTLLSGDGAVGKTTIAMQLAVAVATDMLDWLQNVIDERGPVLFLTAEEELSEVHFRLEQVVDYYPDLQWTDLANLHLLSMADSDCVLAVPDRMHILKKTKNYERLSLNIEQIQPKLVIVESAADLFAGNEIDRSQVRKFISLLRELAIKHDCAIMLLSHPSVSGMASGSGMSGSTQWNNAVRSRMYFKTIKADADDFADEDAEAVNESGSNYRELQYLKNNRARQGEKIKLVYTNGLFLPERQPAPADKAAQESKADDVFMTLLRRFNSDGSDRSATVKKGQTFAPYLFALEREAKNARVTKAMLTQAMERLITAKKIRSEMFGPQSKRRSRLIEITRENTGEILPFTPKPPEPSGVSIPFMITKAMKAQLAAKGYSESEINALTPQQAQDILAST
jgi:RecA-family ATPase